MSDPREPLPGAVPRDVPDALPPDPADAPPGAEPPPPDSEDDTAAMSIIDHLDELRRVLFQSLITALLATIIAWFFSARLLNFVVQPVKDVGIYFTSPYEAFVARMKLSAMIGLMAVAPFILFKVYGFILPGLYRRERRYVTPLLITTTLLFYAGAGFAFFVVIPTVVTFLLGFGTHLMQPLITIGNYFAFVSRLCLGFGVIFELPIVVFFFSILGIVDPSWLLRGWRYALVIIATASAILTPPDIFSQLAMAIPVSLLYISSVLVAMVATRGRRRRRRLWDESEPEITDDDG